MSTGTLSYKTCQYCGVTFVRGMDSKIQVSYCSECAALGHQEEAYKAGCNVIDPKDMGKVAYTTKVGIKDCPKVTIEGEAYRDITGLMFED